MVESCWVRLGVLLWVSDLAFLYCAGLWSCAYLRLFATVSSGMAELIDTSATNDQTLFLPAGLPHQVLLQCWFAAITFISKHLLLGI